MPATTASGSAFSDPGQLLNALALTFIFGLAVILLVVILVLLAQRRYFEAAERLARRGLPSRPGWASATSEPPAADEEGTLGPAAPLLSIAGPDTIVVGTGDTYTATLDGQPTSAAAWSVDPPAAAKVKPATGATVTVTASRAGPFRLVATVGDAEVEIGVTAEAPPAAPTVLPFIGGGWGSVIVSILVAVIVAVLGLAGVLDGQAIAGLYGVLVGYLFGVKTPTTGGEKPKAGTGDNADDAAS